MKSLLQHKFTRFRAYQLGAEGSSFSYFKGDHFTLIEARLTDVNRPQLKNELKACGVSAIHCLHITSWDKDHCAESELEEILGTWSPEKIEYPGYDPHSDTGISCLSIIQDYKAKKAKKIVRIDPPYIASLDDATRWGYRNIFYWPTQIDEENSNNNSTVKFFRSGCFNVLSFGDLENESLSGYFKGRADLQSETDIMILAHHGADNGFTTKSLLKKLNPTVTICSSNYDNKFEHPKEEIRELLHELNIPIFTTKTGDVIIESIAPHKRRYAVWNLIANSEEVSSKHEYKSKKSNFLENSDRARCHYESDANPFKKFY